jgi:hypothetical protein
LENKKNNRREKMQKIKKYYKPNNKLYVICDMDGNYWSGDGWWDYADAKKFSIGAAIACMRQLKKMGYNCYYDRA